jgi:hypothetical protein
MCAALGLFLWRSRIGVPGWLLAAAVFLLPLDITLEYQCLLAAVLLLYVALEVDRRWAAHLATAVAGALLALLGLVKGTGLLSAGAVASVFVVLSLVRGRLGTAATLAVATAVGFTALWALAGQPMSGVPPYLKTSYELSSGYSAAMSYTAGADEPLGRGLPGVLLIGGAMLAVIVAAVRRDLRVVTIGCLSLPLLLVGFKEGFVRGDVIHQVRFYSEAVLLLSPLLILSVRRRARWDSMASVAAVAVAAAALLLGAGLKAHGLPPAWQTRTVVDRIATYPEAAKLVAEPQERRQQSAAAGAVMRATYQVPGDILARLREGTVDVAPFELDIVYAYGLDWVPRPVLQTYSAYTPGLDRLDAEHFGGPGAPDRVLFMLTTIDGRYPLFDEPEATWTLLHGYHVEEVRGPYVVLVRGAAGQRPAGRAVGTVSAPLGGEVSVPQLGSDVRASIEVDYTPRGRLRGLVYRPTGVHVQFVYGGGQRSRPYRLIAATARDGVPVGWFVPDTGALPAYMDGHPSARISAIAVSADSAADYEHIYRVSFEAVS